MTTRANAIRTEAFGIGLMLAGLAGYAAIGGDEPNTFNTFVPYNSGECADQGTMSNGTRQYRAVDAGAGLCRWIETEPTTRALFVDNTTINESYLAQAYALCIRDFELPVPPITKDSWKEERFQSMPECKKIEIYL